jgi:hypothetical protein
VGFLLLWVVLLNMIHNVCPSQKILNQITQCFNFFRSLRNILGCQIGHPTSTDQSALHIKTFTPISVCVGWCTTMYYEIRFFKAFFFGANFCNGDKI